MEKIALITLSKGMTNDEKFILKKKKDSQLLIYPAFKLAFLTLLRVPSPVIVIQTVPRGLVSKQPL